MHNLFVSVPSARGVHPLTMWNVVDLGPALEKVGHRRHGASVYRMPLGLARNELACAFLSEPVCDLNYLLDDDVQVEPEWVLRMMGALDAGADIVSAPCLLRDHGHGGAQTGGIFNVLPFGTPSTNLGELRLLECAQTGLGAVMVTRRVLETLHETGNKYASRMMPQRLASDIFTEKTVAASELHEGAEPILNVYVLDDIIFSMKARAAGFKIYAAIDVPTVHDGVRGCFSEAVERLDKARAKTSLMGPDGKPAR